MNFKKVLSVVVLFVALTSVAFAQTFYVNNQAGNDANGGTTPSQAKKTVSSALYAAPSGSTISVAYTGIDYDETTPGMNILPGPLTPGITGTYTFVSTGGTPVFTNAAFQVGTAATVGKVTLTGPFQFNQGLNLINGELTNGNQLTVKSQVTRTEFGSIVSGDLVYSGNVNLFYVNASTGAGVVITTGPEWPNAQIPANVTSTATGGAITVELNAAKTMKGILNTAGVLDLNTFVLTINGDNASLIGGNVIDGTLNFVMAAAGASISGGFALPNIIADNSANTPTLTTGTTITGTGDITVNNAASLNARVAGNSGNLLANGTGTITWTGYTATSQVGTVTTAAASTSNITFNNNAANPMTTMAITHNGIGVIQYGANVNTINVGTTGTGTNVILNTVVPAFQNGAGAVAIANIGQIIFRAVPVTIYGSVQNNASFSGSTDIAGNDDNGRIEFLSTTQPVVIAGSVINNISGSFSYVASSAGNALRNGGISFAEITGGSLTMGDVTNSSTADVPTPSPAPGFVNPTYNGSIFVTAGVGNTYTITFANMLCTTTDADAGIYFNNTQGAVNGVTVTQSGSTTGGFIRFGNGNVTLTGDLTNSRGEAGADIVFGNGAAGASFTGHNIINSGASNITFTSVSGAGAVNLGSYGITSSGTGTISFPNATGAGTFTFTNFSTSNTGTVSFGNGTGAISASGVISLTSGTIDFGNAARTLTFSNAVIGIGAVGLKPTFTQSALTNMVIAQPIPNVNQTITLGTLDTAWPGYITVSNAAIIPAPYVIFASAAGSTGTPGNLYILNTTGAGNGLTFATAAGVVNTVKLDNARLYVGKNDPSGAPGGNFQNTTGYVTVNGGFVMMSGNAQQQVNTVAATTGATFGNFGVDNNAVVAAGNANVAVATACTFVNDFYLAQGKVANTLVAPTLCSFVVFNGPTPYPTIFRTEGLFMFAPTFTSYTNVTYYGYDKVTSVELPSAVDKLWNLTVSTTNGAKAGYGIIKMTVGAKVNGTLTIDANQSLYTANQTLKIAGASAVVNGYLVDDGNTRVQLAYATGTVFSGTGVLPSIQVNNGSAGNKITGYVGLVSYGFGADGVWSPGVVLPNPNTDDFAAQDGNILYEAGVDAGSSLTVAFTGTGNHIANLTTQSAKETFTLNSNVTMSGDITQNGGVIAIGDYQLTQKGTTFLTTGGTTAGSAITSSATGALNFVTHGTTLSVNTADMTIAANVNFNAQQAAANGVITLLNTSAKNLLISGNVQLLDNTAGTWGTSVDIGAGKVLTLGGQNVTVQANSKFVATDAGTTGILDLDNLAGYTLLTFSIPGSTSVRNLTIDGNVTLAGGIASSTLTVVNLRHNDGLFTFGSANVEVDNTFWRTAATATYSGDGWFIWNGTSFDHSKNAGGTATVGAMTINKVKLIAGLTLLDKEALVIVKSLWLYNGNLTNQVGGTGAGYVTVGDATNVPMIIVDSGFDVLANALAFATQTASAIANADYTYNNDNLDNNQTISARVWPVTPVTLARDVTVELVHPADFVSVGTTAAANRQINRSLYLIEGTLLWDSPVVLTLADGVTVYRDEDGYLDKDASGAGAKGTLTAPNVNLVYTNNVGDSGIEYSDPTKVSNLTLGTSDGTTPTFVTLTFARKVEGVVSLYGTSSAPSILTVDENTEFTKVQTIAVGGQIDVNTPSVLTFSNPTAVSTVWVINGGSIAAYGPFTVNGPSQGDLTVVGALTLNASWTFGKITASDNVTLAAGVVLGPGTDLQFVSSKNSILKVPSTGAVVGTLTISKTLNTNTVTLDGGNLATTLPGFAPFNSLYLVNGLLVTGANTINIADPLFGGGQGFDRTGVTGTNISHVVGNCAKTLVNGGGGIFGLATSSEPRQEWPVGNMTAYSPVAVTFNPQIGGLPTTPNATITVSYADGDAAGYVGLPIANGVAEGVDIGGYPGFYWYIVTTPYSIGPSTPFDMELTAGKGLTYDDYNQLRIIRRHGQITDPSSKANSWLFQAENDVPNAAAYDNSYNVNVPTVIVRGANAGLRTGGAIFTYGLKTKMKVTAAIPEQWLVKGAAASTFDLTNVFVGNVGTLTYTAKSDYNNYVTATVDNATLSLLPVAVGNAVVTVWAQDAFDNDVAAFSFNVHVGLTDVTVNEIPTEFALFQNYPNPFNPTTNIKFDLPKESNVTLKVYNVLGAEVATLVNSVMPAGHQEVKFDAAKYASGMYIYRIEAGSFVQVKKMLLMK